MLNLNPFFFTLYLYCAFIVIYKNWRENNPHYMIGEI